MGLTKMLLGLDSGMYHYSRLEKGEEDIDIVLAVSIYITSNLIMEQLPVHLEALRKLRILEVFNVDLDLMTNVKFWMKNYKLKSDMESMADLPLRERGFEISYKGFKPATTSELYEAIERNIFAMVEMLTEVQQILTEAPAGLYENFYLSQKAACDPIPVKARYRQWKREVGMATPELLKDKEMQELVGLLTKKVMRHAKEPSERERRQMDLEKLQSYLPHGYVLPTEFSNCYARFCRYAKDDGDTLTINYDCYGEYLHESYYKLTPDERQALIEFDIMLDLIHQDLMSQNGVTLPDALDTPEGRSLMEKARQAGYLNEMYQPTLSRAKAALLADAIAERLKIRNKWKIFELLWHRNYMRSDYNLALTQQQSLDFQDELKRFMGEP